MLGPLIGCMSAVQFEAHIVSDVSIVAQFQFKRGRIWYILSRIAKSQNKLVARCPIKTNQFDFGTQKKFP